MQKIRYPGVTPFSEEQRDIFYGREKDIKRLSQMIHLRDQVLLYAKSGIGKTSLLHAGVLPNLKSGYTPIKIRFTAYSQEAKNPISPALKTLQSINQFLDAAKPEFPAFTLWSALKNLQFQKPGHTFLLVFDQFEELFSYPADQVEEFKTQLFELINNYIPEEDIEITEENEELIYTDIPVKFVYAIRSDRLSLLNRLSDKISNIQQNFYELTALTEKQAREAIINPAQKEGDFTTPPFAYEEDALNKMIGRLTNNGAQPVETTQLQIVCRRIEKICLTLPAFRTLAGLAWLPRKTSPISKTSFLIFTTMPWPPFPNSTRTMPGN